MTTIMFTNHRQDYQEQVGLSLKIINIPPIKLL